MIRAGQQLVRAESGNSLAEKTSNQIRQRVLGVLLKNAILRWESVVTLVITIGLFMFVHAPAGIPGWQNWFWLVGGAIAEGVLIAAILSDQCVDVDFSHRIFQRKHDLSIIHNSESREQLENAIEYRRSMLELVERHKGAIKTHLQQTVNDVDDWIAHMYHLAQQIDAFESNELVERDRHRVPEQIEKVRLRLSSETNPAIRTDLENQERRLEIQLDSLEATVNSIKRAKIQLESALTALGTIYAQMSLLGTKDVDGSRAQRLRSEIQDEVENLQDTIDALGEVQAQQLRLS